MVEDAEDSKSSPGGMEPSREPSKSRLGLVVLALALAGATAFSVMQIAHQRRQARELAASRDQMSAALTESQTEIQALSTKLEALRAASENQAAAKRTAPTVRTHHARAATRPPADDPRWKQLQSQLSGQEEQLATTRAELDRTRDELQDRLSSTRDELDGSIARTHEELVALEKRGARDYHEFQLTKSKRFQRVGSISLSLRKVNAKHKSYNLAMIVDDFTLEKKNVNLYEPVVITLSDRPQPLELVVNKVSKDEVEGYLSEPKYKKSDLATTMPARRTAAAGAASTVADSKAPSRLQ